MTNTRCGWCGEPSTNCPNTRGECCCLPCYEYGHAPRTPADVEADQ